MTKLKPPHLHPNIERILFSESEIRERVRDIAERIDSDYNDRSPTFIILANGAIIFGADLIRRLSCTVQFDILSVSSYQGTKSTKKPKLNSQIKLDLDDRDVVVVDDIFDTGCTLVSICRLLEGMNPRSVKSCVLLAKNKSRDSTFMPDYIGFEIADEFVVGYGLDFNESYRNLPYIGVFKG